MNPDPITVQVEVNAPISKVWEYWNHPEHIINWAFASDDWKCPAAQNDLQIGGAFTTTMAAKDGSAQFDVVGTYTQVETDKLIEYKMDDGRMVKVEFQQVGEDQVKIAETFDPENENPTEMQRDGWQAILDNFKKYTENN